jgi:hypothetical protein
VSSPGRRCASIDGCASRPFEGGQFDVVEAFLRAAVVDEFGFEQADLGFGQRVVQGIADRANVGRMPILMTDQSPIIYAS